MAEYLTAEPGALGDRAAAYGHGLPFLFKIIAVERGLSIQAHPDRTRAREGFAADDADGIPRDAPNRNYRDGNHKPELVCALTEFVGLCGFRPHGELADELRSFRAHLQGLLPSGGALDPLCHEIRRYLQLPDREGWRQVFLEFLRAREDRSFGEALVKAGRGYAADRIGMGRYRHILTLLEQYPGDPGALAPLYMNIVTLEPGEALFLDAGVLHAYLQGTAVELMANSDNVLRAGCTDKHVNARELVRILRFENEQVASLKPVPRDGLLVFPAAAEEFQLFRVTRGGTISKSEGPAIILNLGDTVRCSTDEGPVTDVPRGHSIFADHGAERFSFDGFGDIDLYVAALPGVLGVSHDEDAGPSDR